MNKQEKSILRKLIHNVDEAHAAVVEHEKNIDTKLYESISRSGKEYREKYSHDQFFLALNTCKMEHEVVMTIRKMID